MPVCFIPETLAAKDVPFEGGFMTWDFHSGQAFRTFPADMLPHGSAYLAYICRDATFRGESAIHAEYIFDYSDITLVTYWTHGGKRIA